MRYVIIIILLCCNILSCKLGTEDSDHVSLNPKLKRVLYWGYNEQEVGDVPNQGPRSGINNKYPMWADDSTIYTYIFNRGIIKVTIDPVTLDYQSYQIFELKIPYIVKSLNYDAKEQKLFIIYYSSGEPNQAAYVTLSDSQAIIDQTIVDSSWDPADIKIWHGKPGMIFYGTDPQTNVKGFYWRRPQPGDDQADSLLYAFNLDEQTARGFAVSYDGTYLYFGDQLGNRALFMQLDISQSGQNPLVIADRLGNYISTCPHSLAPHLVLISYYFPSDAYNPPQGHIELLNTDWEYSLEQKVAHKL